VFGLLLTGNFTLWLSEARKTRHIHVRDPEQPEASMHEGHSTLRDFRGERREQSRYEHLLILTVGGCEMQVAPTLNDRAYH
jgi:hypothetical protein